MNNYPSIVESCKDTYNGEFVPLWNRVNCEVHDPKKETKEDKKTK